MDKPDPSPKHSSDSQHSVKQYRSQKHGLDTIFAARLITDINNGEADILLRNYQQIPNLTTLLADVEQVYNQNQPKLASQLRLCNQIDTLIKAARAVINYSSTFLRVIEEIAFGFLTGRDAFRNFIQSRAFQTTCTDLLDEQRAARRVLLQCRIMLYLTLSDESSTHDFSPLAYDMATVEIHFIIEYHRYASDILIPPPTDDNIAKLREMVVRTCFRGGRGLGRLFALVQNVRRTLLVCESRFLDFWQRLSAEDADEASRHLALLRQVTHSLRRNVMIFVAIAMQFAHDDNDDRFIAFCRDQEDRISFTTDNAYTAQRQSKQLLDKFNSFPVNTATDIQRCPFAADPVELSMQQVHPELVPAGYNVFLAHDSTENSVRLANYLRSEIQPRLISCYTEHMLLHPHIPFLPDATERALDDTCVGVFLLTPEFAKQKLKVAQMRHMLRRVHDARVGWPGPTLIPVFYKLTIKECRDGNVFGETEEDVDVDVEHVKKVFDDITRYTGIENLEGVTDDDSEEMQERRTGLVGRMANAVTEACYTIGKECKEQLVPGAEQSKEVNDEHKESVELIRQEIITFRQLQREARERASLF